MFKLFFKVSFYPWRNFHYCTLFTIHKQIKHLSVFHLTFKRCGILESSIDFGEILLNRAQVLCIFNKLFIGLLYILELNYTHMFNTRGRTAFLWAGFAYRASSELLTLILKLTNPLFLLSELLRYHIYFEHMLSRKVFFSLEFDKQCLFLWKIGLILLRDSKEATKWMWFVISSTWYANGYPIHFRISRRDECPLWVKSF